jgi:hypothetical protein
MRDEIRTMIGTVATNEWTILLVRRDGSIANIIGLETVPSVEEIKKISEKYSGCAFQFLPRGNLNEEQVKEAIRGLVEALEYSRTHEMKPGVNIPQKDDV